MKSPRLDPEELSIDYIVMRSQDLKVGAASVFCRIAGAMKDASCFAPREPRRAGAAFERFSRFCITRLSSASGLRAAAAVEPLRECTSAERLLVEVSGRAGGGRGSFLRRPSLACPGRGRFGPQRPEGAGEKSRGVERIPICRSCSMTAGWLMRYVFAPQRTAIPSSRHNSQGAAVLYLLPG